MLAHAQGGVLNAASLARSLGVDTNRLLWLLILGVVDPGFVVAAAVPIAAEHWPVGEIGVATTSLRPAGKARVGGKLLDVVAEGDFVEAGTSVVVVKKRGLQTVVRRTEESA